jgi:hypothetical protein
MGIEIVIEDEHGKIIASIEDPANILHQVLPSYDNSEYRMINCIDWYGDTVFNRYQVPEVRRELKRLTCTRQNYEELLFIRMVDEIAAKVEIEPHLYLKFYGD